MKAPQLVTTNPLVELVAPDIERDAALGVDWLSGELGRDTLRLMGVADKNNFPSSLEDEKERVAGFINGKNQLNWMIKYGSVIVGSIWVELEQKEGVPAPSVHIMIGDPDARGKGIGATSTKSVVEYLRSHGNDKIYSRHLITNVGATKLLEEQGFSDYGEPYTDEDGLSWQNMALEFK